MFRFETPEYLYLLLLLPIFALAHYMWTYRKRRNLRRYGDPELLKPLMKDVSPLRTELKFWFLQLSIMFLVIALARPQYGTRVDTRKRSGIEAIIAMDISNSMLAEDVRPNRLEKAKMMVSNLVDNMTDDKIGLIVYAGQAYVQLHLIPLECSYEEEVLLDSEFLCDLQDLFCLFLNINICHFFHLTQKGELVALPLVITSL